MDMELDTDAFSSSVDWDGPGAVPRAGGVGEEEARPPSRWSLCVAGDVTNTGCHTTMGAPAAAATMAHDPNHITIKMGAAAAAAAAC